MIEELKKTYEYPNGEIQRIHAAVFPDWDSLDFVFPENDPEAFDKVCDLYRDFIVPKAPYVFGTLVFFKLPVDVEIPFSFSTEKYGVLSDPCAAVCAQLKKYLRGSNFRPEGEAKAFCDELEKRGCLRIIKGSRPLHAKILPVGSGLGKLSELRTAAGSGEGADVPEFICNCGFFTMDMFDIGSVYDSIGTPIGLCVKNGEVINPPLFEREALTVYADGRTVIEKPKLSDLKIRIGDRVFENGISAVIYERPKRRMTPSGGTDVVIIGRKVAAVHKGGRSVIPSAGFILKTDDAAGISAGSPVSYLGAENIKFAVQAGNSAVLNGDGVYSFRSYFSNIRDPFALPVPPSLYPLDYEKARAPRMTIGAGKDGRPVVVWAEGPGKFSYEKGKDSCGASLSEMADICKDLGLINAVNLDGGGSAQIMINGKRSLKISDRYPEDNSEKERAVPIGLTAK